MASFVPRAVNLMKGSSRLTMTKTFSKVQIPTISPISRQFQTKISNRSTTKTFEIPSKRTFAPKIQSYATLSAVGSKSVDQPDMFCFQCEQTNNGTGCTTVGVCGKTPEVAGLQDLLIYVCKGISQYMHRINNFTIEQQLKFISAKDRNEINVFVLQALFSTLTNVNFDSQRFVKYLQEADSLLLKSKNLYEAICKANGVKPETVTGPATVKLVSRDNAALLKQQAEQIVDCNVFLRKQKYNEDLVGLQELVLYGLKGAAAYADHAQILNESSEDIYKFVHSTLDFLTDPNKPIDQLLGRALEVGKINLEVMAMIDKGATTKFGDPVPTKVNINTVKGKAILVSGHDLNDMYQILKQTEGKGVNVYSHGELLPAHGYPKLKQFKHFVGNYGGAWQMQKLEFSTFPGAIILTSNCIVEPKKSYKDRIFTSHAVGWEGVKHIEGTDFSQVIDCALKQPGFQKDEVPKYITVGFGRNAVLSSAGAILDAVGKGQIKHFFLIGGCDGAEGERSYFKDVALNAPKDSVVLTLACGKYRFNKFDFGNVPGTELPRLIDIGQCNDAYGAIQIASGLANALGAKSVNELPLSFVISWFEQKAVAVLLTLLHLGVKNIYLGPNLPAFATPNMLNILVSNFGLKKIGDPVKDTQAMLQRKN